MKNILSLLMLFLLIAAQSPSSHAQGVGASLWQVDPFIYLNAVVGHTDLEDSELTNGGHAPSNSGFSIPSIELGFDAYYGEYLGAYGTGNVFWNKDDGWDAELEELYLKANRLPYGFDIQAGRFLATIGSHNNTHHHEWSFVDNQLGDVRFLSEDGLIIEGIEVAWRPRSRLDDQLIVSYGSALSHDHEEEEAEAEHAHSEEAEEALWDKEVLALRYRANFQFGYNHSLRTGVSYLQAKNFMDQRARLYGGDTHYTWVNDKYLDLKFTWVNEVMFRDIDTDEGSFDELTYSSRATFSWDPKWTASLRYDYLEGVEDPELAERHRISPAISRMFNYKETPINVRLQYNYDHSDLHEETRNDHSVWLQFNYQWGSGTEVHNH